MKAIKSSHHCFQLAIRPAFDCPHCASLLCCALCSLRFIGNMLSLSALLASPSLLPKCQYLGCWHTRTSWMSWVMESVKPCVYTLNMDDVLWRILTWIPIYRSLPIFHWLQLANLMCCPLHDYRLTNDSYYVLFTTWFQWCGTHFAVIFHTCKPLSWNSEHCRPKTPCMIG